MEYQRIAVRPQLRLNGSSALVADQVVALGIRYKGTSASATVTVVSATGITLKHGTAAAEAVDTTVGASSNGVVDFATDTTLGAVVDRINTSPNWQAEIIDGLRADSMASSTMLARSETTLSPVRTQVLPLYFDTSAHLSYSYCVSPRRLNFNRSRSGYQAVVKDVKALVNVGSGTLTLNIYNRNPKTGVTTLLFQASGTDNVELALPAFGAGGGELRSEAGQELLVRYTCSVDCPDSGAYLRVVGFCE